MNEQESFYLEVSYLRARDPSIVSWSRSDLKKVGKKLFFDEEIPNNVNENEDSNIAVYLRIKHTNDEFGTYSFTENEIVLKNRNVETCFPFSKIFGPTSSQNEIFDTVVKPKMLLLINGLNSSLITYGTSGSGKTYTMMGTACFPGIIPRALEYLFRSLPKLPANPKLLLEPNGKITYCNYPTAATNNLSRITQSLSKNDLKIHHQTYKEMSQRLSAEPKAILENNAKKVILGVYVSFLEIYNEEIYDLLADVQKKPLPKLKTAMGYGGPYVKNLTLIYVTNGLEAYNVFQHGLKKVRCAEMRSNDRSSRSHSIFTIKLVQALDKDKTSVSYFNFCDLAGGHKRESIYQEIRFKESKNINTSLFVFGKCLKLMMQKSKKPGEILMPYRESKLTTLLQNSLNGIDITTMIVTVNTQNTFDDNVAILSFAALIGPVTNPEISKANKEIEELKEKLEQVRLKNEQMEIEAADQANKEAEKMLSEVRENYENKMEKLAQLYEDLFQAQRKALLQQEAQNAIKKEQKIKKKLNKSLSIKNTLLSNLQNEKQILEDELNVLQSENATLMQKKMQLKIEKNQYEDIGKYFEL